MSQQDREELTKQLVENSRKQLAEKTWPEVMQVFGYFNPRAPRTSDEEFARLKAFYEKESCTNMAKFIDFVRFEEKANDVTMSFNLSLRKRLAAGDAPEPNAENVMLLFSCPDILVGTRTGVEGAAVWFKNFSEHISSLPPEAVQVTDKIFGEAIVFFQGRSFKTSVEELPRLAASDASEILNAPKVSKH